MPDRGGRIMCAVVLRRPTTRNGGCLSHLVAAIYHHQVGSGEARTEMLPIGSLESLVEGEVEEDTDESLPDNDNDNDDDNNNNNNNNNNNSSSNNNNNNNRDSSTVFHV
jgi:hypothetical protein